MTRSVLIMAGGTGGHVFPALAAARVLRERGFDPVWLGTRQGLESKLVPPHQIPLEWISISGLRGKGLLPLLSAPMKLLAAIRQGMAVIRRRQPVVVLGAGGFVSGPGGIAAWLMGRPLVIHEQNAVAGMTNRILSRFASRVLEGFPNSFPGKVRAEHVGNPVRREITALPPPEARFAGRTGKHRLFVFGGSQGAAKLNAALPAALALLPEEMRPEVLHQAGEKNFERTVAAYAEQGVVADVRAFIDDMAAAYAWTDLVVCRAGALTVAEVAAAGVGALFIPFAAAVDDHQTRNAQFLVGAGAGRLLAERDLTPDRLAAEMRALFEGGREALAGMAANARRVAIVDADVRLAEACIAAAGGAT
jgi:UDP-N-acetylglucosamine--N-acetylmuramyl-(pentapeptide) pyrophosphoryl-undecaprenol N-acetylglucosamine transferase